MAGKLQKCSAYWWFITPAGRSAISFSRMRGEECTSILVPKSMTYYSGWFLPGRRTWISRINARIEPLNSLEDARRGYKRRIRSYVRSRCNDEKEREGSDRLSVQFLSPWKKNRTSCKERQPATLKATHSPSEMLRSMLEEDQAKGGSAASRRSSRSREHAAVGGLAAAQLFEQFQNPGARGR